MRGEEADALRSHTGTCLFWDFVFHSVFSAICILMTLSAVTADSAGLWGHNHCRVQGSQLMPYIKSAQEALAPDSMSAVGSEL